MQLDLAHSQVRSSEVKYACAKFINVIQFRNALLHSDMAL